MKFITVKPGLHPETDEPLRVVMPPALGAARGVAIAEAGERVELTPFVQRRLDCGDLVQIDDAKIAEKEEAAPGSAPAAQEAAKPAAKAPITNPAAIGETR